MAATKKELPPNKKQLAPKRDYFPRVKEAREELRSKAKEIIDLYLENARNAMTAAEFEVASKALQFLIEHMPADEDGSKLVDTSVDKMPKQVEKKGGGNRIQIGLAIGDMPKNRQIQSTTVEVLEGEIEDKK